MNGDEQLVDQLLYIATGIVTAVGVFLGIMRGRPTLLFTSIGLMLWLSVVPASKMWSAPDFVSAAYTKPAALGFVWSICLIGAALIYHRRFGRRVLERAAVRFERTELPTPKAILFGCGVMSALAVGATFIFGALSGGSSWARQQGEVFAGQGALTVVGGNIMAYPLAAFYLWRTGNTPSIVHFVLSVAVLAIILPGLIFSGTTGGPLGFVMPFAVIFAVTGIRFSFIRLSLVIAGGYAAVWFLRFMRLLGQLTVGGQVNIRLSDALSLFEGSGLQPGDSFGEFFWFSRAVAYIDSGGSAMGFNAYKFAILQFVPGVLWSGKVDASLVGKTDVYMRDIVLHKMYGGLIPVGMYGEAYLSFGILSLIAVAVLVGLLSGWIDARFRTTIFGLPGPLACALFCPLLLGTCRGGVLYLTTGILSIVIIAIVVRLAKPLSRGHQDTTYAQFDMPEQQFTE